MNALASGFIGAAALTAIHETARQMIAAPPRMDVVGMRGLEQLYRFAGAEPPWTAVLYRQTIGRTDGVACSSIVFAYRRRTRIP